MRLSPRRRRPDAAGARSVWPPLRLAAQQDTHTDPVETRFFLFFFFCKKKKTKKEILQRTERSTCPPHPLPRSPAVRLLVQARPARAQRWEPASVSFPTAQAWGTQVLPGPSARAAHEGAQSAGPPLLPGCGPPAALTSGWPVGSPDPPGAPSAGPVSG